MVQRSNMWYAYFRFYIDEDDIKTGLDTYCKEWENMFAVGYNYQEYKCFVDNLGGFEHWVGDMQGYISQTREIGFIDAAPSDSVYDSTLLMGSQKITIPKMRFLHAIKPPVNVFVRKIVADYSGTGKIKSSFGAGSDFIHNFYYSMDENIIEKFKYTNEIVESVTGNFDIVVDLSKNTAIDSTNFTIESSGTFTYPEKIVSNDWTTYAYDDITPLGSGYVVVDLGEVYNIYNFITRTQAPSAVLIRKLYYSEDDTNPSADYVSLSNGWTDEAIERDIKARYLKFHFYNPHTSVTYRMSIYGIFLGIY